ncbi:uncharacterized protein LOC122292482 [Carya illinoinensis]|uniref:uncharacterized protein LOC122292482 n=1 Tax=Carya illinoinensis TaxID=32201 RepID=UPI001C729CBF|nr:uncharacterized protein LOC122292482 [Carya illinoinensis]
MLIIFLCMCYDNYFYCSLCIWTAMPESRGENCSSSGKSIVEYPICYCGIKACQRIAHTDENEGRRFFGCQNYMSGKSCGYFCWYDPEIPSYCQKTIKRLQHSIDKLKLEVEKIQASMDIQSLNHRLQIESEKRKRQMEKATYVTLISLSWFFFVGLLISSCGWFKGKC